MLNLIKLNHILNVKQDKAKQQEIPFTACELCGFQKEQRRAIATEFAILSCHMLTNMVGVIEGQRIKRITKRELACGTDGLEGQRAKRD